MKTRAILVSAVAGLASVASAQTPTFQYSINAPANLNPGQTATITVLCGFTPGVGGAIAVPVAPGAGTVLGLSSGTFGIAGSGGSWGGNALTAPYNFIGTSAGTNAGGNVSGVIWGNGFGPPLGTVSTVNPTPLWSATFTMPASNVTLQINPVGNHGVWAMPNGGSFSVEVLSTAAQGAQATILVPAPASLALLGLGGLVAARRRR